MELFLKWWNLKQLLLQANSVAKSSLFGAIEMEVLEEGGERK